MENQELLTIDELSQRLKVPPSWIYDKTRRKGPGTIPAVRVGKYLRFNLGSVLDWCQKKGEERDPQ